LKKPGAKTKENKRDMRPVAGRDGDSPPFNIIWANQTKVPFFASFDDFRMALVLVYRNAYLLDHKRDTEGHIRYSPSGEVAECIDCLESELDVAAGPGAKVPMYGLACFLHFLDLLAWNEDARCHADRDGRLLWTAKYMLLSGAITPDGFVCSTKESMKVLLGSSTKSGEVHTSLSYRSGTRRQSHYSESGKGRQQ
jgi:hypothetical protein